MKSTILLALLTMILAGQPAQAQESKAAPKEVIRVSIADGQIQGQVFAVFNDEKAPLVGKVSLTDINGNAISTSKTDETGNFSFANVEPGKYRAVGVAGDYVGDAEIEVTVAQDTDEDGGYYTSIPIAVAPAQSSAMFDMYATLPAASFSSAPVGGGGGGCSSCGGGYSRGTFGGGSCSGGGFNFRRLALLGAAIALPIALSGGNDDNGSPDEE